MERMETTARTCTFFGSRQRRMQGNLCYGWWFVPSADPFGQGSKSVRAFMGTITSPSASRSPLSLSATFRRFLLSLSLSFSLPPPRNPYENSPPCEVCSAARTTFLRSPAISRATVLFFFFFVKKRTFVGFGSRRARIGKFFAVNEGMERNWNEYNRDI